MRGARTLALAGALLAAAGCGRSLFFPAPDPPCVFDSDCAAGLRCVNQVCRFLPDVDAGPTRWRRGFGEGCDAGDDCRSGLCVGGPRGAFCSQACDAGCPPAWACKEVPGAGAACAVAEPLLCQECASDLDCGASGADLCTRFPDEQSCGRDCTFAPCPPLYGCEGADGGPRQCVPLARTCLCTEANLGLWASCSNANDAGRCLGAKLCGADGGFGACSAATPAPEVCNGLDDDCSGAADDLPPTPCARTSSFGTCTGTWRCGDGGATCDAPLAQAEQCNFLDDDCDGLVDDGFRDDAGLYAQPSHCGGCGNDCLRLLEHATAATCLVRAGAPGCRATACAAGYFATDAGTCAPLSDGLCRQCVADSDCPGPGSACVALGPERVCGRACGSTSPWGACPTGYTCAAQDGGASQCVPQTRTCLCTQATLGTVRGCTYSTCRGYQACAAGAQGPAWSDCDVASYNQEICDTADNDCDGVVDEGFRNPSTGRYESAQSCGFCNNDCTRIWSPTLQHVTGVCDAAAAFPTCRMGPCTTEVQGGTTYEWVDTNRQPGDGCECRRVQGNVAVDLPDRFPATGAQPSWVDENCDGLDGVEADALFVYEKAAPLGDGSRARPFQTVWAALSALPGSGKRYVLVAEGTYRENVVLFDGAQLFGGYSVDFLERNPALHPSVLQGQPPSSSVSGAQGAVHAESLGTGSAETVVAGFVIRGGDAPGGTGDDLAGLASVAVYLRNVGAGLLLASNDVQAGRGGPGGRGSTGAQGTGRQSSNSLDGLAGLNSGRANSGTCPAGFQRDGGAGGTNSSCLASAARGGNVVCPYVNFDAGEPVANQQEYVAPDGGLNGAGGFDWSFHPAGGSGCNQVSTHGKDQDGRDGLVGRDGTSGPGGAGAPATARHGSVLGGRWAPAPWGALPGGLGTPGIPGGGGGAGGGAVRSPGAACTAWEWGASGGGGGAGACGGSGGKAGGAGGASLGIFVVGSPGGQLPRLQGNRIARNFGGAGGPGGFGGAGGLGGRGGLGGQPTTWSSSMGGKGGEGGNGGLGGGGGGGAGGPSFGIFGVDVDVAGFRAQNTFVTAAAADTGGPGGVGGSSAGPVSTGGPGAAGAFGEAVGLRSCPSGCAGGTACDLNGLCVPQ